MTPLNMHRTLALASAALLGVAAGPAAAKNLLCVWDVAGKGGDVYNSAIDYSVAMQKNGVEIELKSYVDERVAVEDYRAGQCDAVIATAFRIKPFNATSTSLDSIGSATVVRDSKIDMAGSYEVVRKVIQAYASPAGAKMMVEGNHEIGGIFPFGAAYPIVADRKIDSVEALAGKKIAALEYDQAQAMMIQRVGGQAVATDINKLASTFNSGAVDMIAAPTLAYKPLELNKGIGTKGGIGRFPLMVLTYQVVLNKTKFPEGFGAKSREYWVNEFDRALKLIANADAGIPAGTWLEITPAQATKYNEILRESRIAITEKGVYNKQGLKIIKKVRCSVNPSAADCSSADET